jgi:precorrin-6B methylase 2
MRNRHSFLGVLLFGCLLVQAAPVQAELFSPLLFEALSELDWKIWFELFIGLSALLYAYYCWRTQVPIFPSSSKTRRAIVAAVVAEAQRLQQQSLTIYDLGAGFGGLALSVGRALPQAKNIGIEYGLVPVFLAKLFQKLSGCRNVEFRQGDFWQTQIADADIVLCYLGAAVMPRLAEKIRRECRAGSLIISNDFAMPSDWSSEAEIIVDPKKPIGRRLLLYRVKP